MVLLRRVPLDFSFLVNCVDSRKPLPETLSGFVFFVELIVTSSAPVNLIQSLFPVCLQVQKLLNFTTQWSGKEIK